MTAPDEIWSWRDEHHVERNPHNSFAVEYARIDPNTCIVTIDQLDRCETCLRSSGFILDADEIREIIGDVM